MVREDAVCRRLMTVPGVGPLVAMTYKSAIEDPSHITKSKAAGALFGLTPKKYQSGEKDITGGITRTGDEMVRTALYEAANVLLGRITRFSKLKRWGLEHVPPQLNRGILVRRRMGESIGTDSLLGAGRCRRLIPGTCVSE